MCVGKLMTMAEASELLSLSRTTIWRYVSEGKIPAVKFGRSVRIPRDGIEEYVGSCYVPADGAGELERAERARRNEETRLEDLRRRDRARRERLKEIVDEIPHLSASQYERAVAAPSTRARSKVGTGLGLRTLALGVSISPRTMRSRTVSFAVVSPRSRASWSLRSWVFMACPFGSVVRTSVRVSYPWRPRVLPPW